MRPSVQMVNGEIFEGEKIRELSEFIINKFSEEGLSYDKAKIVMEDVADLIGECSLIDKITNA